MALFQIWEQEAGSSNLPIPTTTTRCDPSIGWTRSLPALRPFAPALRQWLAYVGGIVPALVAEYEGRAEIE